MDIAGWIDRLRDWVNSEFLVWTNLYQFLTLAFVVVIAWMVSGVLQKRYQNYLNSRDKGDASNKVINHIIFPATVLVFVYICLLVAQYLQLSYVVFHIVSSLLLAWIIIRFISSLITNISIAKPIAFFIWLIAALNILGMLKPSVAYLDSLRFSVGNINLSLWSIAEGLFYLVLSVWLANLLAGFVENKLNNTTVLTPSARVLAGKFIRILLITAAFFLAISAVGIDLTIFAVFGGALGVGLGFGLQKVVSNFISGIILLLDKSIKPGDVIAIGDTYGWVKSLNARYVSLETRDGVEHLIPNEELIITRVENWSFSNSRIRLRIPVGVHYNSDVRKAVKLCVEAASQPERILDEPKVVCHLKGFGDSSVDLEIRAWIGDPQNGRSSVINEILLGVWDKFHEHGIEIPYPQRDIHFKNSLDINGPSGSE
jgi:small-conductance mechanosensitive channel